MGTTADQILTLLAAKHHEDVFVSECKDGPSIGSRHQRMDAWVMRKSWKNPCITVYEIKVSRSDFLRDDKWRGYMALGNRFYFVCPAGIIEPGEVGNDCGLLWGSKNLKRLYEKKRAPYREIETPESVYQYILMCRTEIVRAQLTTDKAAYWATWLEHRRLDHIFGGMVSKRISETVSEQVHEVGRENERLRADNEKLAEAKAIFDELGLGRGWIYDMREKIDQAMREIAGGDFLKQLEALRQQIATVAEKLDGVSANILNEGLDHDVGNRKRVGAAGRDE